jgi:hypothetical protein
MRNHLGALCAVAALATATASSAAAVVYKVDLQIGSGTVTGDITTDGATGVLSQSDITGWNLTLNGPGASYQIASGLGAYAVELVGSDLTATAKNILFNFSGDSQSYFILQDGLHSGSHYFCAAVSDGTCLKGESDVPQYYTDASAQFDHSLTGAQIIASVPEPATWAMLILGVAAIGRHRRLSGSSAQPPRPAGPSRVG